MAFCYVDNHWNFTWTICKFQKG